MGLFNPARIKVDIIFDGAQIYPVALASGDGAISAKSGFVAITKGSAAALTLADPATSDNGKIMCIVSTTGYAHTVTSASGFNGGGASSDVATFGAAAGNSIWLLAYGGLWYALNLTGVTLA